MRLFRIRVALAAALLALAAPAFATTETGPAVPAFVIDGGTRVTVKGATKLTMNCDLKNQGVFTPSGGSAVVVNGFLAPTLSGVTNFADLTIASHGTAWLATNATVGGTLSLNSGWLSVAGHDLIANTISGGSAASYIVTPDTLSRLARTVGSFPAVTFPVGGNAYSPVSVRTGTGVDVFRIATVPVSPTTGLTPSTALSRAWYVSYANAPGANGNVTYSVQFDAADAGASFERTVGGANSAWAWRWNGASWSPQAGVRRSDNGVYPAVDTLVSALPGVWTMGGVGSLLDAEVAGAPASLELAPVWPNPFRGSTSVRFGLPHKARVTIAVYSVLGERVATLADGEQDAGWHVARLDAARMANGVYFLRVQAGAETRSSKLVVMR